tara:strand:+ start:126 stop:527 length:402 start_codon:yes stop_codon:yes gene_type:complete
MEDELITFPTAKLAKEKGFNWEVYGEYWFDDEENTWIENTNYAMPCFYNNNSKGHNYISAPTQSLLASWLRLTFDYHIYCVPYGKDLWEVNICTSDVTWNVKNHLCYDILARDNYKTYEEAMEIGLVQALKLI